MGCSGRSVGRDKLLLETGLAINGPDGEGCRVLSRASENGHEAVAKRLIEKGADVNIVDQPGLTALRYTSGNDHEAMTKLFINKDRIKVLDEI